LSIGSTDRTDTMPRTITADKITPCMVISHYGAIFEITETKVYPNKDEPDYPVYVHKTRPLDVSAWTGPKHWTVDWVFQGNKLAYWWVINR
jgi:hypothetical protein